VLITKNTNDYEQNTIRFVCISVIDIMFREDPAQQINELFSKCKLHRGKFQIIQLTIPQNKKLSYAPIEVQNREDMITI